MRRSTIVCAIAAGILALAPFSAAIAAAAPQYTSSSPANGAELHEAPVAVSVSFSEPLDADSELRVFACGKRVDAGNSTVTLNELEVALASGPTGLYEARWVAKGFGGVTGTSAGLIEFSVGHGDVSCGDSGHGEHGNGSGKGHEGEGHNGSGSGHEGEGHNGSGHSGSGHSEGSNHSGSGHSSSGSSHSSGSHNSSSSHSASGGHSGGGHGSDHGSGHGKGKGKSKGHGSNHGDSETTTDEEVAGNPNFAADGPLPIPTPEAGAVVLALFACVGLGITGGWLARLV